MRNHPFFRIGPVVLLVLLTIFLNFRLDVLANSVEDDQLQQTLQETPTAVLTTEAIPTEATSAAVETAMGLSDEVFTFEEIGYPDDDTAQGVNASRTYGIRWPESWIIQSGSSVTIEFSHPLALAEYSTMAADFNGVRIGSIALTAANVDHGSVRFNIPANLIQSGYNGLTLVFYMGISENHCDDLDNPGVWATIHNTSFFNLPHSQIKAIPDLGVFPYPFLQPSELLINQVTVIVPDNPTSAELNAVATILAKLGQLNSYFNMNIDVLPASRATNPLNLSGNLIFVGLANNLQILLTENLPFVEISGGIIKFIYNDGQLINQNDGVLWTDTTPNDNKSVRLIVTGQTDQALEKAAKGLADDSVYTRLTGQFGIIQEIPTTVSTALMKPVLSLEDLGYTDETAAGTTQQAIDYVLRLTSEWRVATEATLNLHFAHSALLNPKSSTLTIQVNGIPVGSSLLSAENAENGQAAFKIPARLFQIGNNTLTIMTNMQLPYDPEDQYFCDEDQTINAWVTVFADSALTLPDGPTSLVLNLRDFPAGFTKKGDLSDTVFVVADAADWSAAQAISWIASRMGRFSASTAFSPNVVTASQYKKDGNAATNHILVGEPLQNQAISQLSDILPLPFAEGSNNLKNPEKIAQIALPSGSKSIGYLQCALSKNGDPRLVVSGNSVEGVLWAAKALNDQVLASQLKGNYAILDSTGTVFVAFESQEIVGSIETTTQPVVSESPLQKITGSGITWVMWLAGGLLIVTFIFILIFAVTMLRKKKS